MCFSDTEVREKNGEIKSRKRKRSSCCVAEAAEDLECSSLPVELQMEVLSHLPAEDVVRLRVVNRQWATLLGHPRLIALWSRNRSTSRRPCYLLRTICVNYPISPHYYKYPSLTTPSTSASSKFRPVPRHWRSRFSPDHSYPYLSEGGLVLCVNKKCFWVGNPLTKQWVKVPPLLLITLVRKSQTLFTYVSKDDGRTYFRIWFEPYVFDSRVGIWTMSTQKTMSAASLNTLLIGGVRYTLGFCWQHLAVVLLKLDDHDPAALSESTWVYAWDWHTNKFRVPVLLEVGGEVGLIAEGKEEAFEVFVLDRNDSSGWRWNKVSTLPTRVKNYTVDVSTQGNLTFVSMQRGVAVFDSQALTWGWVEEVREEWMPVEFVVWEPDLTAVANLNTPSEELRKMCASNKYKYGNFLSPITPGCFSGLEALFKSGMSWQKIGRVACDPSKGGRFVGEPILEGEAVENRINEFREKDFRRLASVAAESLRSGNRESKRG